MRFAAGYIYTLCNVPKTDSDYFFYAAFSDCFLLSGLSVYCAVQYQLNPEI